MRHLVKVLTVIIAFNLQLIALYASGEEVDPLRTIPVSTSSPEEVLSDSVFIQNADKLDPTYTLFEFSPIENRTVLVDSETLKKRADSLMRTPVSRTDSLMYASNSLTLPLIYTGRDINQVWDGHLKFQKLLYPSKKSVVFVDTTKNLTSEYLVAKLRADARRHIANRHIHLYTTTIDQLPNLSSFMSRPLVGKRLDRLEIYDNKIQLGTTRIDYQGVKQLYWIKKANAMLQFSQNYVSPNWHQGGLSNLAFLSILLTEFNYDNRKGVQWDNKFEWRSGFNSVDGDTLRKISTNDDLVRYLTKFGVKAGGNWYYSTSGEFSTHLFNSYKGVNSNVLKTTLLTPVRANVGIGMDYKYKKIFSLMIAPISFKYIYVNDTINVNPNSFGIQKGENHLKQIGSSLLAQFNYSPMLNWNISSKFTVYTDYKKVEADWEIVNVFTINRFLTARLLVNPRYDNTVIEEAGKKAKIQLKELLSVGFSYRFI